jgi:hypothetical protein
VEVQLDVLTSRDALVTLVSVRDDVPAPLEHDAAVTSLGGPTSEDADAAQWLVGRSGVDGLALAIVQAAAYVRQQHITVQTYVEQFKARQLELFRDRSLQEEEPLSQWAEVEAWLVQHGVAECAGPLRDYGVESLAHLRPLARENIADLGVNKRLQGALWQAIIEGVVAPANPAELRKVQDVLAARGVGPDAVRVLCDPSATGCGVRCVNDLRGVAAVRARITACSSLHSADKERVLDLIDAADSIPVEDDPRRRTVLTTWSLSMERVAAEAGGLGPAAVDALRLSAFMAPDGIPLELLHLAEGPATLRSFIAGEAEWLLGDAARCLICCPGTT